MKNIALAALISATFPAGKVLAVAGPLQGRIEAFLDDAPGRGVDCRRFHDLQEEIDRSSANASLFERLAPKAQAWAKARAACGVDHSAANPGNDSSARLALAVLGSKSPAQFFDRSRGAADFAAQDRDGLLTLAAISGPRAVRPSAPHAVEPPRARGTEEIVVPTPEPAPNRSGFPPPSPDDFSVGALPRSPKSAARVPQDLVLRNMDIVDPKDRAKAARQQIEGLDEDQAQAVVRAHDAKTLAEKVEILHEAGLGWKEIREILERGLAGSRPTIANWVGATLDSWRAKPSQDLPVDARNAAAAVKPPKHIVREWEEAEEHHARVLRQIREVEFQAEGKDGSVLARGARSLRLVFLALSGIVMAVALGWIDFQLLKTFWASISTNVFGTLTPEMLASTTARAFQVVGAILATHFAYEILPRGARRAYVMSLFGVATAALAVAGGMMGATEIAAAIHSAASGVAGNGIMENLPGIVRPSAPAAPGAPGAVGMFNNLAANVPGVTATLMGVSAGIGGIATNMASTALHRLGGASLYTPEDLFKIKTLRKELTDVGQHLQRLEQEYPALGHDAQAAPR